MQETILRIAIMIFVAFLVGIFKEPFYLLLLFMLVFTRKKQARKDINAEFDTLHDRLDLLIRAQQKDEKKD